MKYLYKPKKKSIIIFFIFFTAYLFCTIVFLMQKLNPTPNALDFLLLLHLFLPVILLIIAIFIVSYIIFCIEKWCSFAAYKQQLFWLTVLKIIDIILSIVLFLSTGFLINNIEDISALFSLLFNQTIYFQALNTIELSVIYKYWSFLYFFSHLFSPIIFICAFIRKNQKQKVLKQKIENQKFKNQINIYLGYDYESCEFYKQTQIPYVSLMQKDGTRGEFEAYHVLMKNGLEAEYIFNREIPKDNGLFTELDLIILHKNGIIVLENKHYSTRIYGKATDYDLTIIDHTGQKISIYNPIRQNEQHVAALTKYLQEKNLYINDIVTPIYSVVVFTSINNRSDDIISGIDPTGTKTTICTSENLYFIIQNLLLKNTVNTNIDILKIKEVLTPLSIRQKTN